MASPQPAAPVKSIRSKTRAGIRRRWARAESAGCRPVRRQGRRGASLRPSAIRASWSLTAAAFASRLADEAGEAADSPAGESRAAGARRRSVSGAGPAGPRACPLGGERGESRCGANRGREPPGGGDRGGRPLALQTSPRGDSLPPAASQLSSFCCSLLRWPAEAVSGVGAGDHVTAIDRSRQRDVNQAQRFRGFFQLDLRRDSALLVGAELVVT